MSGASGFLLAAGALLLVVLAILLTPLLRRARTGAALDRRAANLAILRSELRELERERTEGALKEEDFEQARQELQRRLLEEAAPEAPHTTGLTVGARGTALALAIALPLAAAGGYALLGTPQALDPAHRQTGMNAQEIDALLQKLIVRLDANPDDMNGWVTLARTYKALGRYAQAAEAFAKAEPVLDKDAALLADYAEALAEAHGGQFAGKPDRLLTRALQLDPGEPQALFLAGASANERRDFAAVIDYWGRLLPQLEAGSEEAQSLEAAIAQARQIVGTQGGKSASKKPAGDPSAKAAASKAIAGEVILSGKLAARAKPDDPVFLFARAADGSSRMPIAVQRLRVADLPYTFRLDDALSMQGGPKLSEATTVILEARIAKAGMATRSSGDLFGVVEKAKVGSTGVRVTIDQVQP